MRQTLTLKLGNNPSSDCVCVSVTASIPFALEEPLWILIFQDNNRIP